MALTTLKKALPQDRYIKITSSNIGTPAFSDRDFGALIFTTTSTIVVNGVTKEFAFDKMIEVFRADQALRYFGTKENGDLSDEADLANQYFAYRSPNGYSPRRLSFVRIGADETPLEAITRINGLTNNFGGFMFLQSGEYTAKQMKDVITYVSGLDYKYLFGLSFAVENVATEEKAAPTSLIKDLNARDFLQYVSGGEDRPSYLGTSIWLGHNVEIVGEDDENSDNSESDDITLNEAIAAYMPLAIFGSIRYSGANTVTNFMFKQFPSQVYTVDDEEEADAYDHACVNYIGLVQANGDRKAFSQQGYNINGEATNTYCNEVWLKSEISTALLNLFLSAEVVDAGEDGQLLVYNTIASVAVQAKTNGTITAGKTLDEDQKTAIYQLTQDNEAWRTVQNAGYVLSVWIERVTEDGKTFYKAFYRLVYSKNDAILKVEGQHALV